MAARWIAVCGLAAIAALAQRSRPGGYRDWRVYGGGLDGIRYSSLSRIDRGNVSKLKPVWRFDTGDASPGSEMQCNPIVIGAVLYATTPSGRAIALKAETGSLLWSFDPEPGRTTRRRVRNRGVSSWTDGQSRTIFHTHGHWLFALDAATGRPIATFGEQGRVDLRHGLGRDPESVTISVNTPGPVFEDLLILGSTVGEDLPSAPGDIRAFDVRTGRIRWTFRTIPAEADFGFDTWPAGARGRSGGANNWAGMALDAARGIVYVPTGSAAFDFHGADRHGANLFANTLLALDARTGRRKWHFQAVHHDVWDRDLPSPPSLITVRRGGRMVDAVVQPTKQGFLFTFDRDTGAPLFPIEERPVPASTVPGERLWPTQPFPLAPPPFTRQRFTEDIVTRRTPEAHAAVLARLRSLRSDGPFAPPDFQGAVVFPGLDGGAEWGGAAFDPETGLLYVNANERVQSLKLVARATRGASSAAELYRFHCESCHAGEKIGAGKPIAVIEEAIAKGNGRMPAFAALPAAHRSALARFVATGVSDSVTPSNGPLNPLPYRREGRGILLDPDGYPGVTPPWGTLTAIDMDKGTIAWQVPLGEHPELAAKGLRNTGSENYGGPVVTAGGLIFIGATSYDRKFRAFDKRTGELLHEWELPFSANSTPAVYEVQGRQYVVAGAGGGKEGQPSGGVYTAFRLP